jgi:hypothetical protein
LIVAIRDLSIALEHTRRARNSARGNGAGRSVPGATRKIRGSLQAIFAQVLAHILAKKILRALQ